MKKIDPESLWVWRSNKGYWSAKLGRFVKYKKQATIRPWWYASLVMTVGNGKWVPA